MNDTLTKTCPPWKSPWIVALFFLFRDGERLLTQMNRLLPLRAEVKTRIEERVRRLVRGGFRLPLKHAHQNPHAIHW